MTPAKTVRIKFPANLRVGYCQIPEAEFDPKIHELWEDAAAPSGDGSGAGNEGSGEGGDETLTAAQVLEMAGGNFMAFKSAAAKVLGDDCPSKKAEIIEALKAKA